MWLFNIRQPISQFIFLVILFTSCLAQYIDEDSRKIPPDNGDISEGNPTTPALPSEPTRKLQASPIKPTIIVIVAVLSVLLFITSLLLLYAKHCKLGTVHANSRDVVGVARPQVDRKNSGMDRVVVESLPLFRFRSLRGQKEGLECAVCLNRFEPIEILRLLPKCNHAFHVECVDTWLDAHSTCPLCRYRVDQDDIRLVEDNNRILSFPAPEVVQEEESSADVVLDIDPDPATGQRQSSVGEVRESDESNKRRTKKRLSLDDSGNRGRGMNMHDKTRWMSSSTSSSSSSGRRVEHRIVVSECYGPRKQRWPDCELVLEQQDMLVNTEVNTSRSLVMNKRSVSEFTSMSRFPSIRVATSLTSSKSSSTTNTPIVVVAKK